MHVCNQKNFTGLQTCLCKHAVALCICLWTTGHKQICFRDCVLAEHRQHARSSRPAVRDRPGFCAAARPGSFHAGHADILKPAVPIPATPAAGRSCSRSCMQPSMANSTARAGRCQAACRCFWVWVRATVQNLPVHVVHPCHTLMVMPPALLTCSACISYICTSQIR